MKTVRPATRPLSSASSSIHDSNDKLSLISTQVESDVLEDRSRYQRIVLEETPPRVILQGHETYEDLVNIGKSHFWSPEDAEGCEFTLCNADGTRWSKEDFLLEFPDASAITYAWKRTLFVGRKELSRRH